MQFHDKLDQLCIKTTDWHEKIARHLIDLQKANDLRHASYATLNAQFIAVAAFSVLYITDRK
jgi:hypothetical protein